MIIKPSEISGIGVFADKDIEVGSKIIQYLGKKFTNDQLLKDNYLEDHSVQIGPAIFLGPSGREDDLINHSCNPNAGLKIFGEELWLVSINYIKSGQEITFDYSTTLGPDESWYIPKCQCKSVKCRGVVGKYDLLPKSIKDKYEKLGIDLVNRW